MGTDRSSGTHTLIEVGETALDLVVIVAATALLALVVFVSPLSETAVRTFVALAFVFVVPGYALVSTLFPERPVEATDGWTIDGFARFVLSIGLSVSLVPLIGAALTLTPAGLELVALFLATSAITLLLTIGAAVRRYRLPKHERFRVPIGRWIATSRTGVSRAEGTDVVLTVVLVASILFATVALGYAVAAPQHAEEHSTITLLTEDDGELVTDGYPTDLEPGASEEFVVAVDNHEGESTEYTVVVLEQEVDEEVDVIEQHELDRFETQVANDDTEHIEHDLEPAVGEETRIVWLLYTNDAPDDPSIDTADEYVHLWTDGEEQ